jgi:hypothetical protein
VALAGQIISADRHRRGALGPALKYEARGGALFPHLTALPLVGGQMGKPPPPPADGRMSFRDGHDEPLERIGRQALFAFDPETAHGLDRRAEDRPALSETEA